MQRIDGQLVLSPTDLTKHLACPHVTTLDLAALDSPAHDAPALAGAKAADDALNLVFSKGMDHERAYLQRLRQAGLVVTEIPTRYDLAGRIEAEQQTLAAMRTGVDVIYQATFYDGQWGGQADFLLRTDRPSDLGDWSYDIADTKLARRLKVPALLQMATYAERLAVLQGVHPEFLTVVTGDGVERPWRLADVASFARRARSRLRHAVDARPVTEAVPAAHCSQCRWSTRCGDLWEASDDLSLVAGMRKDHRQTLVAAGISTVADLGRADPAVLPRGIGKPSRERLTQQARLQMVERTTGAPAYELLSPESGKGLLGLPAPSPGDVYLDFEGDPFAHDGAGREYLAGLWDREGAFTSWWAHSFDREQTLTEQLIDDLIGRLKADPDMHIYHYAAYEQSALKRLTGRHGTRETELDTLLRGERFVDLYAVVRGGIRISKGSYSIKKLEDFYWGHTRSADSDAEVADAMTSVVEYERFLVEGDAAILDSIEAYNREDVRSTHDLHAWLEQRRDELETVHGAQARPEVKDGLAGEEASAAEQAEAELAERLREAGQPLLAGLVGWHRREDRPKWWEFFRVEDLDDEMLVEDGSTIGGLSAPVQVGEVKASLLWRYDFEPQECKLSVGKQAHDVDEPHAPLGEVVELDPVAGHIVLKRSKKREPAQPRGFGPDGPINVKVLQASIARVGTQVLAGESPLGRALLERRVPPELVPPQLVPPQLVPPELVPPQLRVNAEESPSELVVRAGRALSGQVRAVQGPPGSGKTTTGAAMIRALLDDGLTVGVTALSHKVINNLLLKADRPALQKWDEQDDGGSDQVTIARSNGAVLAALSSGTANLVGGTAWLWARADMQDLVDVLVIDEAGQFSLANAVAVSSAARSMVLLGDPQQLTQPTQAVHPDGAGISALDHLLDGHDTIPADRGVFLDKTYRMHPAITGFVSQTSYDGRLASAEGLDKQRVQATGALSGSGLRWLPLDHEGNASASDEEAATVAALVNDLCRGTWFDAGGGEHRLTLDDLLVVAPYNRHVARLIDKLPKGARVGTVDKFQGQQAPVVIYSMASSSAADAPRGVDFLYDLHRLNVAVSRARALTCIVASPDLLDAEVHTPDQLRVVNALCRYVEEATMTEVAVIGLASRVNDVVGFGA
ncbi:MAG: TM0106 family RecB-like putative nuclease [Dermatophilaceae bacterium]